MFLNQILNKQRGRLCCRRNAFDIRQIHGITNVQGRKETAIVTVTTTIRRDGSLARVNIGFGDKQKSKTYREVGLDQLDSHVQRATFVT